MMYSPSRLVLVTGPKHSGKSLCSVELGKITGYKVVDLDELTEKQTGKSPRTLYIEGPEIFRKAEALALDALIRTFEPLPGSEIPSQPGSGLVVAAGGGLIDNSEAVALLSRLLNSSGCVELIVVYLEVSAETAWQRIIADGELPPFLGTENSMETHLAIHRRRSESYKAFASITILAENKTPREIAMEIAGQI